MALRDVPVDMILNEALSVMFSTNGETVICLTTRTSFSDAEQYAAHAMNFGSVD